MVERRVLGDNGGMTQPPLGSALRGAVDLSGLAQRSQGGAPAGGAAAPRSAAPTQSAGTSAGSSSVVVDVADAEAFSSLVSASVRYPVIITLWAASQPQSKTPVDELSAAVRKQGGKLQLGVVDIDQVPEIAQAFQQMGQQLAQQGQLPPGTPMTTVAFLQGQPMPIPPLPDAAAADQLIGELVKIAVQNGLAGRVPGADDEPEESDEQTESDELPALHQEAYDAIDRGDYDAATSAFERAIAENPDDHEARLGLGQVRLIKRTQDVDPEAVRRAAADDPKDVGAATQVADLDVMGGHVEDAFARLIDLVRSTAGDERNTVREHLVGLFDIVGATDPRVKKARSALMAALY